MNQLFLRLYLLAVTATLSVVFGSFLFVAMRVLPERNQAIAELLVPELREVAEVVDEEGPSALAEVAPQARATLAVLPASVLTFTDADRAALRRGEVIVRGSEFRRFAYAMLPSGESVLEFELLGLDGRIVQWTALVAGAPLSGERPFEGALTPIEEARLRHRPIAVPLRSLAPAELLVYERDGVRYQVEVAVDGPGDFRLQILAVMLLLLAVAVLIPLLPLQRQLSALGRTAEALAEGDTRARVPLVAGGGPVHPVAEQINRMAQEIEDAMARNQELLRSVAHEMRTPLSRLLLGLDLLDGDEPGARAERVAMLQATVVDMQGLTNELLDFSRLGDRPEVERSDVDLVAVVQEVASRWPGTTLEVPDTAPQVPGEPRLVARAIDNAVRNAVRYASPPVVRFERLAAGWAVLVDDAGPGIASEDRERVFEPFERLEASRSRETGGTGLGLPIVRRILEAHGGEARIDASPEGGARLRLEWPDRV
ncbi:MAG: ATP-binding protein [Myxococcota bacterium]